MKHMNRLPSVTPPSCITGSVATINNKINIINNNIKLIKKTGCKITGQARLCVNYDKTNCSCPRDWRLSE